MKIELKKAELEVSFLFCAAIALMLILDDSGAAAIGLASCVLHECGHLLCLLAFGEVPKRVSLNWFGMRIERARGLHLSLVQEACVALAGPAVNLFFAVVAYLAAKGGNEAMLLPSAVNIAIAGFNILPVEPLDGNRALYYLLCRHRPEGQAQQISSKISICIAIPLVFAGVMLLVHSGYNFTLLAVAVYLFVLLLRKKEA